MSLHGFYNPKFIGDVLMLRLGKGETSIFEKKDDLVILYDCQNKIIGYNIFNAKNHFTSIKEGFIEVDEILVSELNKFLSLHQLDVIVHDFSSKFIVGEIIELEPHPDSDHMHICKINLGNEVTQIVCGASNVELNKKVVVATLGAVMPSGLIIQHSVLRKVESNGMLCSAKELKLENSQSTKGIILLDDSYVVGSAFLK